MRWTEASKPSDLLLARSPLAFWRSLRRSIAPVGPTGADRALPSRGILGRFRKIVDRWKLFAAGQAGPPFIGRATPNCGRCPAPRPLRCRMRS